MTEKSPFLRNLSMSNEDAYVLAAELEEKQEEVVNGVTIYSGRHPQHGNIHIVVPAIGDEAKALLPFELLPVVVRAI